MGDDVKVDSAFVDFGDVDYAIEIVNTSPLINFRNISNETIVIELNFQYLNVLEEFPVILLLECNEPDAKEITLLPDETKALNFSLRSDADYINKHSVGTSYFKVSRRFNIPYRRSDSTTGVISMGFTANLCSSVLFLEKSSISMENKVIGEEFSHDIMIWNRSESNLLFSVECFAFTKIADSEEPNVSLSIAGTTTEVTPETVISVPSFAPKILTLKLYSEVVI